MKYANFFLIFVLVVGCSASVVPGEATVPPVRIYDFARKSDANLVVTSTTSLRSDCIIRMSIDGKSAADLFRGEVAHFGLTIGSHNILASTAGRCSKHWAQKTRISVKAGDALIVRIDQGGISLVEL